MRTLEQQIRYQKLELVSSRSLQVTNPVTKARKQLGQVFHGLLRWLTTSNDPRIWSSTSKSGQTRWHVYDPTYQQRLTLMSEDEVRVWLDNRYNR